MRQPIWEERQRVYHVVPEKEVMGMMTDSDSRGWPDGEGESMGRQNFVVPSGSSVRRVIGGRVCG